MPGLDLAVVDSLPQGRVLEVEACRQLGEMHRRVLDNDLRAFRWAIVALHDRPELEWATGHLGQHVTGDDARHFTVVLGGKRALAQRGTGKRFDTIAKLELQGDWSLDAFDRLAKTVEPGARRVRFKGDIDFPGSGGTSPGNFVEQLAQGLALTGIERA
ncbi:hypothetical protein D3C79_740490 [compost metagenome]